LGNFMEDKTRKLTRKIKGLIGEIEKYLNE
jgi:hypothetical protein